MKIFRMNCAGLFPAVAVSAYYGASSSKPTWVLFHGDPPQGVRNHWQMRARVHNTAVVAERTGQLLGITRFDFALECKKHLVETIDKPRIELRVSPNSDWNYLLLHDPGTPVNGQVEFRVEGEVQELVRATTSYGLDPLAHCYPMPVWLVRGRAAIEWVRRGDLFGTPRKVRVEFQETQAPRFKVEF